MAIPESWIRSSVKWRNTLGATTARVVKLCINMDLQMHPHANDKEIIKYVQNTIAMLLKSFGKSAALLAQSDFVAIMNNAGKEANFKLYEYNDVIDDGDIATQIRKSYRNTFKRNAVNQKQFIRAMSNIASSIVNRIYMMNVKYNAHENDIRYASVPAGKKTSAWCMMLASKGALSYSEEAEGVAIHQKCNCALIPIPKGEYVEGWDGKAQERMGATMRIAGINPNTNWHDITPKQRAKLEALVNHQNVEYYRSGEYGMHGETQAFKNYVISLSGAAQRYHQETYAKEKRSAKLLQRIGIDTIFDKDTYKDDDGLIQGSVCLVNHIDLNTIAGKGSKKAIKKHFKKCVNKKRKTAFMFFDFRSLADYGFNEKVKKDIEHSITVQMKNCGVSRVLAYYPDGTYKIY